MEVKVAKSAGFCFGVKRAVSMVYDEIEKGGKIYTLGPIIHNEEVVSELSQKGVGIVEEESLDEITEGTLVIRSHGIAKRVYDKLENKGIRVVDGTCPFVKKIHNIVFEESKNGSKIVIVGNDGHAEVEGIKGWCINTATVIGTVEEAENFVPEQDCDICVVSQTTFNSAKFKDIVEILKKKSYNINAVNSINTICSATQERQSEARELAREVDCMIVIGGKNSSNSRKLYEICSSECENTHFIQTLADLNLDIPKSTPCVGITAGASTPNKIIEEVQNYVRINF